MGGVDGGGKPDRWLLCDYARAAGAVLADLVWPVRCAICESPGACICERCRASLPFVDQWLSCPRCGAPFGVGQCTECNGYSLGRLGLDALPFDGCVSAVLFDDDSARIVRRYKDAGEQGLAGYLAYMVACTIPPGWLDGACAASFVPSTPKAIRRRGFDHCRLMGGECAGFLGLELLDLLQVGRAIDQRRLGRAGRFENMRGRFTADAACKGRRILLFDDVLTTGATLMAASEALKRAGAESVFCATFARVY